MTDNIEISKETYIAAREEFNGYKYRNPLDRYTLSQTEIINKIAIDFHHHGVRDVRGLIGCFVDVSGKGWS